MKTLYLCLIVIHSLLYGSSGPLGESQIHIMSLRAGFGIWVPDLAVRFVKSHVARQLPRDPAAASGGERVTPTRWALRPLALPARCPTWCYVWLRGPEWSDSGSTLFPGTVPSLTGDFQRVTCP